MIYKTTTTVALSVSFYFNIHIISWLHHLIYL